MDGVKIMMKRALDENDATSATCGGRRLLWSKEPFDN